MKAVITAAGYASRLWPLTKDTPKPLLEINGRPIIEHILSKIAEIEAVDAVYVVSNAKFYSNFVDWLAGFSGMSGTEIKILNDGTVSNDDRLGQVGDIIFAMDAEKIDDDLLVVAGDNLFNFSLLHAYGVFLKNGGSILNPLWESKSYKAARESGSVVIDEETNRFVEFMEKSPHPKSTLISLGIYFFPKEKLKLIRKYVDEKNNPDKMGFFLMWLMQQEPVIGHIYTEAWFDIGWIEALEKARKEFVS